MNKIVYTEHRGVFDQQIYDFFENDIESCLMVSKARQFLPINYNFPGGTNFTAALVILSVIEMMAAYYFGIEENKNNKLHPTSSSQVAKFLNKYFAKNCSAFSNEKFGENFHKVFRHGLSHQFSPKRAGVDMNFYNNDLLTYPAVNVPHLNVPVLFGITKQALRDYDLDLQKGDGIENFIKHFEAINRIDDKEMDEFKNCL
jgi:hypothetical protein